MSNYEKVVRFQCNSYTNATQRNNTYTAKTNQLNWLLEKDDRYCDEWSHKSVSNRLFGISVDCEQLNARIITVLFNFVKKYFQKLRKASLKSNRNNRFHSNTEAFKFDYSIMRCHICSFMTLLKRFLYSVSHCDHTSHSAILCIFKQLKLLLLFMGRLSKLRPELIQLAINSESDSAIYNYYHCYLDIWWSSIELSFIVCHINRFNFTNFLLVNDEIFSDICSQAIKLVLYDFVVLSMVRFNQISIFYEYVSLTPFACSCVKDMFVMIKLVYCCVNDQCIGISYFEQILAILNLLNQSTTTSVSTCFKQFPTIHTNNIQIKRWLMHNIWFISNVSSIFTYDTNGEHSEQLKVGPMHSAFLKLITQVLKTNETIVNEPELCCLLLCIINSSDNWEPNCDLLLPFTEFFLKKLNNNFFSKDKIPIKPKSSAQWKQIVLEITSNSTSYLKNNSFNLYLSLTNKQLIKVFKLCDQKNKVLQWQKFKGKFIANLQPKKLEKINETGILNLFTFYLILLYSGQDLWDDIMDKIVDMVKELSKRVNLECSELILKFFFASLHLKADNIHETKLTNFVTTYLSRINTSINHNLTNLIIFYLDELKLLMNDSKVLNISIEKLLCLNFSSFSSTNLNSTDFEYVLKFINCLLNYIQESCKRSHNEYDAKIASLVNSCFENILPLIKKEVGICKLNIETLVNISYNFSLFKLNNDCLTMNYQNSKFVTIVCEFLTLSKSNPKFTINYLSLILENANSTDILKANISQTKPILLMNWCRILVTEDINQNLLDCVSLNLSYIIPELRAECINNLNTFDIFIQFLKNSFDIYNKCLLNEKSKLIQEFNKYLNDMILVSDTHIKQIKKEKTRLESSTIALLSKIYSYMSNIVLITAPLLYIRGKPDCLLPKMIDSFILPSNFINVDQVYPILQKSFPLFFEGLCGLSYCGDAYLERIIRNVVSSYLPILTKHHRRVANQQNVYLYVKNSFKKESVFLLWNKFLLDVSKNNFASNMNLSPDLIELLSEFCQNDLIIDRLGELLSLTLDKLLICEHGLNDSLFKLAKTIIQRLNTVVDQNSRSLLMPVISQFIEKNLPRRSLSGRLFDILNTIANICPQLLHKIIGEIGRNIELMEKTRNIGTDLIIRKSFQEFIQKQS